MDDKGLMQNYPAEINRFFFGGNFEVVDAVYERPVDTKIVFFSGKKIKLFSIFTDLKNNKNRRIQLILV